uniref:Uncharacterized protein n=1 Tax=Zymomonas mobilis subsp. mobilis str. CP4 = NRRL B-14023 TaxID=627343 RepID=B3GN80_ZYMMB|nr:hypothetical protein [Zymomonas mobilis subsp. mobilis str. CP4 = NRRL B-14023]
MDASVTGRNRPPPYSNKTDKTLIPTAILLKAHRPLISRRCSLRSQAWQKRNLLFGRTI